MWIEKKTMACTTLIIIHYKHTRQYFFTYVRGNMSGDMRRCLTHHNTVNLSLLNQHTVTLYILFSDSHNLSKEKS